MRVVITGASGNVGTALVERLGEDEAVEQIVGVCRREHDWRPSKTTWVYADVASDDLTGQSVAPTPSCTWPGCSTRRATQRRPGAPTF